MKQPLLHEALSKKIIKSFYKVYNTLGYGFFEKVYENSLALELAKNSLSIQQQVPIKVYYFGDLVGEFFADLVVENKIILEIKATEGIKDVHKLQLQNYLKASSIELGYVMNFGPNPQFIRRIFS